MGILVASFYPAIPFAIYFTSLFLVLLLLWIIRPKILINYSLRFVSGIIVALIFLFFGYQLSIYQSDKNDFSHYSNQPNISHYIVRINTPIIEKEKSFKTTGLIIGGFKESDSSTVSLSGEILVYFAKINELNLHYGDEILISSSKINPIKDLGNPKEFEYSAYLSRQNIFHQAYLNKSDWVNTGHTSYNTIKKIGFDSRNYLLKILEDFKFSGTEFAVVSAILLGYDEYLDQETRGQYSGSGAMHILCVSGLHVGIVFMIFSMLLSPLRKVKKGDLLVTIIILFIIWFYALITGLSPSVLRSATMFSFISLGSMVKRKTSSFNSVFASALVLLIWNPNLLFHIGFQLSYLAVLSILLFQPHLSKLCSCKRGLSRKVFDLIAVSIAAQLGTFPIAILYFHQFPNYFLLTNIVVIPLSFIILVTGIFALFISAIGLYNTIIGTLSKYLLYYPLLLMNGIIKGISELPLSVSSNLFFTQIDTLLVYLFIILVFFAIFYKQIKLLKYALFLALLMFGSNILLRFQSGNDETMIIYNVPKYSLIQIQSGNKSLIISDSALLESGRDVYYTTNFSLSQRIKHHEKLLFQSDDPGSDFRDFSFKESSFFVIDDLLLLPKDKADFDYLLLRNNPKISIKELSDKILAKTIIADGSNKNWKIEQWKAECEEIKIPFIDITQEGAFSLK